MTTVAQKNVTAQNEWTDVVRIEGYFNLSLRGPTFTSTTKVTVQRRVPGTATWLDVDVFTAPTEEVGYEPEYMEYRVGVKTSEFTTSDDINIRVGTEDRRKF